MAASIQAVEHELAKMEEQVQEFRKNSDQLLTEKISILSNFRDWCHGQEQLTPEDIEFAYEIISKGWVAASKVTADHLNLHSAVSKIGKAIDRNFISDFEPLSQLEQGLFPREGDVGKEQLLRGIHDHLCHQEMFDVGSKLCLESGLHLNTSGKKEAFLSIYGILNDLKIHKLGSALEWVQDNREKLKQGSKLEFALHRQAFLQLVGEKRPQDALEYARAHFKGFASRYQNEIQEIMGTLLFTNNSRYDHLFQEGSWKTIQDIFIREAFLVEGLPRNSPLAVCVSAGCLTLPSMLSICLHMKAGWEFLTRVDGAPLDFNLPSDFQFHNGFACPILREQCSPQNPAMRLTCGHVISKKALRALSMYGDGDRLRCPYCPGVKKASEAKEIIF